MRAWTTPRLMVVLMILIGAPLAAVAQLAFAWYPQTLRVARLDARIATDSELLRIECQAVETLRTQVVRLERSLAERESTAQRRWLPARDRDGVFDRIAAAVQAADVRVEEMAGGDPALLGRSSRAHLLAAEPVTVRCIGGYAALTAMIERVAAMELPLRVVSIDWEHAGSDLSLRLVIHVPFLPDETLAAQLADAAGLQPEPR